MKVSEFIKWLEQQDQEATVEVLRDSDGTGYYDQGGWTNQVPFTGLEDTYEYTAPFKSQGKNYEATLLLGYS